MTLAQPTIGGEVIPANIWNRGEYMFYPQEVEIAGDGSTVPVGSQSAVWRFERLRSAQLNWWKWAALRGGRHRATTFDLWVNDDRTALQSFTSGILYAPNWQDVRPLPGDWYGPVEFRFDFLLPIFVEPSVFILASSLLGGADVLIGETL